MLVYIPIISNFLKSHISQPPGNIAFLFYYLSEACLGKITHKFCLSKSNSVFLILFDHPEAWDIASSPFLNTFLPLMFDTPVLSFRLSAFLLFPLLAPCPYGLVMLRFRPSLFPTLFYVVPLQVSQICGFSCCQEVHDVQSCIAFLGLAVLFPKEG